MVDSSQIPYAIAIDFDGILCQNAYPDIGDPNWDTIHQALKEQSNGAKLILWTCREGRSLERAVAACAGWGLTFDAVNENLPEWRKATEQILEKSGQTNTGTTEMSSLTTTRWFFADPVCKWTAQNGRVRRQCSEQS